MNKEQKQKRGLRYSFFYYLFVLYFCCIPIGLWFIISSFFSLPFLLWLGLIYIPLGLGGMFLTALIIFKG